MLRLCLGVQVSIAAAWSWSKWVRHPSLGAAAPEQLSALWEEFKIKGNVGKREGS